MIQPPEGFGDEALAVDTYVKAEQGQWVVYMDVIFWTETVQHRIRAYPSRRQAEIAADWIKRAARRDLRRRGSDHCFTPSDDRRQTTANHQTEAVIGRPSSLNGRHLAYSKVIQFSRLPKPS